jgi:hypothetical protein
MQLHEPGRYAQLFADCAIREMRLAHPQTGGTINPWGIVVAHAQTSDIPYWPAGLYEKDVVKTGPVHMWTTISTPAVKEPMEEAAPPASVTVSLEALKGETGLTSAELADMLDTSRRSIYNWLQGASMRPAMANRIIEARLCLQPLLQRSDPLSVRAWLLGGDGALFAALKSEDWAAAAQAAQRATTAVTSVDDEGDVVVYSARLGVRLMSIAVAPQESLQDWEPPELLDGDYDPYAEDD